MAKESIIDQPIRLKKSKSTRKISIREEVSNLYKALDCYLKEKQKQSVVGTISKTSAGLVLEKNSLYCEKLNSRIREIHHRIKLILEKENLSNKREVFSSMLWTLIFLDGKMKESQTEPFDHCVKREKEARILKNTDKADLYKTLENFFLVSLDEFEEVIINHSGVSISPHKTKRAEILPLINKARENEITSHLNEEFNNDDSGFSERTISDYSEELILALELS